MWQGGTWCGKAPTPALSGAKMDLKSILAGLRSEKKTERKLAVDNAEEYFGLSSNIANIENDMWSKIFECFFLAVNSDRDLHIKSPSNATNLSRLDKTTTALRRVAEAAVPDLNYTTIKMLIRHILRTIHSSGSLIPHVGLNYAKILGALMAQTDHLCAIKDEEWVSISRLAWAVLLDDKLSTDYHWIEDDPKENLEDTMEDVRFSFSESQSQDSRLSSHKLAFATVIRHMCRSPFAPITFYSDEDYGHIPCSLLVKFVRYFQAFPTDAGSHIDIIRALRNTLERLELNCLADNMWFSRKIWFSLVSLFAGRNKSLRDDLIIIFKILIPYYTRVEKDVEAVDPNCYDGLVKLVKAVENDAGGKAVFECLVLDSLRLEFMPDDENLHTEFRTTSFRNGTFFTSAQAISWCLLELYADCIFFMYRHEEPSTRMHFREGEPPTKRRRLSADNTLETLQHGIYDGRATDNFRAIRLQTLIFVVDRHWSQLYGSQQQFICNNIISFLGNWTSDDDAWIMLCIASLAAAPASAIGSSKAPNVNWNAFWTQSMRRLTSPIPTVSRAAAHALHAMLRWDRMETHVLIQDIERFSLDFRSESDPSFGSSDLALSRHSSGEVSPPFVTESVCSLFVEILAISNTDASLSRLRLEESILHWLSGCLLRVASFDSSGGIGLSGILKQHAPHGRLRVRADQHFNAQDVLGLLQAVCGLTQRPTILCPVVLPDTEFIHAIELYNSSRTIRRLLLHMEIPQFTTISFAKSRGASSRSTGKLHTKPIGLSLASSETAIRGGYIPEMREGKASKILENIINHLVEEWSGNSNSHNGHKGDPMSPSVSNHSKQTFTHDMVMTVIKFAVISLAFEATLEVNGTSPNLILLRAACGLLLTAVPWKVAEGEPLYRQMSNKWGLHEWAQAMRQLQPLIWVESPQINARCQLTDGLLLRPGPSSGIQRALLRQIQPDPLFKRKTEENGLVWNLLQFVWYPKHAAELLKTCLTSTQRLLVEIAARWGELDGNFTSFRPPQSERGKEYLDDMDITQPGEDRRPSKVVHEIAGLGVAFLSTMSMIKENANMAAPNPWLDELLLATQGKAYLVIGKAYCRSIVSGTLLCRLPIAKGILEYTSHKLLKTYTLSRNEDMQILVISFLENFLASWLSSSDKEMGALVQKLFLDWSLRKIRDGGSWRSRIELSRFLHAYLSSDPKEVWWSKQPKSAPIQNDDETDSQPEDESPTGLLCDLTANSDIRVRYIAGILYTNVLQEASNAAKPVLDLYEAFMKAQIADTSKFEHMMTRLVSLSNAVIVSSPLQKAAYWHLLEVCLHEEAFSPYVIVLLEGISARLGLSHSSAIFQAYASQVAILIHKGGHDFLRLSPKLLGFRNIKECAESTFLSFMSASLISSDAWDLTQKSILDVPFFLNYCTAIQKDPREALKECFPRLIALHLLTRAGTWNEDQMSPETLKWIMDCAKDCNPEGDPQVFLSSCSDQIVAAMLCLCGDIDYSQNGDIISQIQRASLAGNQNLIFAEVFNLLNRFRVNTDFAMHSVNFPSARTSTVLRALFWLKGIVPRAFAWASVYHSMQQIFAAIDSTPLVNEQLRYIHSLNLWITMSSNGCDRVEYQRMILINLTALLPQQDLAHCIQSIMSWVFSRCYEKPNPESKIGTILSRVAEVGIEFSRSGDGNTSNLGNSLLGWVEQEMEMLFSSPVLSPGLVDVISLWPRPLAGPLGRVSNKLQHEESHLIQLMRRNKRHIYGQFRVAHQLLEFDSYSTASFAQDHFWTLRESIPSEDVLLIEDVEAFVNLLYKASGQMQSIRYDAAEFDSLATRHRTMSSPDSVKRVILEWIFERSTLSNASFLHIIYKTLRLLFHPKCGAPGTEDEASGAEYYRLNPYEPLPPTRKHISELKRPVFVELSSQFSKWICAVTQFLGEVLSNIDIFFGQLSDMLKLDPQIATEIFPLLIHQLLINDDHEFLHNSAKSTLSSFFRTILNHTSARETRQTLVNAVLHLRHFDRDSNPLSYEQWLELDYMELCKAALSCGAYATAILFLQLAEESNAEGSNQERWETVKEDILYEIYSHIEEPDGFYAIKGSNVHNHLLRKFQHENKWEKAFQLDVSHFEAAQERSVLGTPQNDKIGGVISSLHSFGFNQLAMSLTQTKTKSTVSDVDFALSWRTDRWDLPHTISHQYPNASVYAALRAVHRSRHVETAREMYKDCLRTEIGRLRSASVENMVELRRTTQALLCLREIGIWLKSDVPDMEHSSLTEDQWSQFCQVSPSFEFFSAEGILMTRLSLLRSWKRSTQQRPADSASIEWLTNLEKTCFVNLAASARASNLPQIAFNAISKAQQLDSRPTFLVSNEFSNILWTQSERTMAVRHLSEVIQREHPARKTDSSENMDISMKDEEARNWAITYAQLGRWMASASLSLPQDIKETCFDPAFQLLSGLEMKDKRLGKQVYLQFAEFSDRQYRQISASPDLERLRRWVRRIDEEIQGLVSTKRQNTSKDTMHRQREKAEKVLTTDKENLKMLEESIRSFLEQALLMYAEYMEWSEEDDQEIAVRFCGLWFSNFTNELVLNAIKSSLGKISPHKFLFLAHQLTARLGTASQGEGAKQHQRFLQQVVVAMCIRHPFHSIFQVLSARGAESDSKRVGRKDAPPLASERKAEAEKIVEKIRQKQKDMKRPDKLLEEMEESFKCFVEWSKYPIKATKPTPGIPYLVPKSTGLFSLTWSKSAKKERREKPKLKPYPVVTADIAIDRTTEYRNITTFHYYEDHYFVVGGVHVPKLISCVDSLGKTHKQLFKGEGDDDLRQDAVMEQVFYLANILLAKDRETKRRSLSIRTYKVVPLTSQTGLLQFVDNTETMSNWLVKAHSRYRPQDISYRDGLALLKPKNKPPNPVDQLNALISIRKRFKPVLRHYFTEKNKQPLNWYAKRLKYSRSVAVCSIIGHILGLGDRHISNILMDDRTGELIQIDLGIAFEQGKLLPVPELVPFRLTPDILDGMGPSKHEGVFRRCAEETLRVLREGSDTIKTVLEVFNYDPLHSWTATPGKLRRVQEGEESDTNDDQDADVRHESAVEGAERALSSVARKLDQALSVEYTVNELINEATDVGNLSRIFQGWSPHC